MVVDASAFLAILKGEPSAPKVKHALANASDLVMASVTLTETILIGLKNGRATLDITSALSALQVEIVAVDESLAIASAEARHRFPIRFGDGFVYALAKARGLPVLTLDAEFMKTDAQLVPLTQT